MNQILSRQDIVHNQTETFGYDCLNRLTSIGSRQATYASNGNVTAIDGVKPLLGRPYFRFSPSTHQRTKGIRRMAS
jgi:hypothetical protein